MAHVVVLGAGVGGLTGDPGIGTKYSKDQPSVASLCALLRSTRTGPVDLLDKLLPHWNTRPTTGCKRYQGPCGGCSDRDCDPQPLEGSSGPGKPPTPSRNPAIPPIQMSGRRVAAISQSAAGTPRKITSDSKVAA
jgi:hypothetical protein